MKKTNDDLAWLWPDGRPKRWRHAGEGTRTKPKEAKTMPVGQESTDELMTTHDAADLADISYWTLLRYRQQGVITPTKVGNNWMFSVEDLEKLKTWQASDEPAGSLYEHNGKDVRLLTTVEAAAYVGVSSAYFCHLVKDGTHKIESATPDKQKYRFWYPKDVAKLKAARNGEGKPGTPQKRGPNKRASKKPEAPRSAGRSNGRSNGHDSGAGMRGIDKVIAATRLVRTWQDQNDLDLSETQEFSLVDTISRALIGAS